MSYQRINCKYRIDERGRKSGREGEKERELYKRREVYREGKRGRAVGIEGKLFSFFSFLAAFEFKSNTNAISLVPPFPSYSSFLGLSTIEVGMEVKNSKNDSFSNFLLV